MVAMIQRIAFLVVVLLAGCARPVLSEDARVDHVVLVTQSGEHPLRLEVAATPEEWQKGLMFRRSLEGIDGMLFIFSGDSQHAMWMKNTFIPLDILFIDSTGTVTTVHRNAVPHDLTSLPSNGPARGAIELNAGDVEKLHIAVGDTIRHPAFAAD
jgi:uncharacterized membrane protein (UPF0127 family)